MSKQRIFDTTLEISPRLSITMSFNTENESVRIKSHAFFQGHVETSTVEKLSPMATPRIDLYEHDNWYLGVGENLFEIKNDKQGTASAITLLILLRSKNLASYLKSDRGFPQLERLTQNAKISEATINTGDSEEKSLKDLILVLMENLNREPELQQVSKAIKALAAILAYKAPDPNILRHTSTATRKNPKTYTFECDYSPEVAKETNCVGYSLNVDMGDSGKIYINNMHPKPFYQGDAPWSALYLLVLIHASFESKVPITSMESFLKNFVRLEINWQALGSSKLSCFDLQNKAWLPEHEVDSHDASRYLFLVMLLNDVDNNLNKHITSDWVLRRLNQLTTLTIADISNNKAFATSKILDSIQTPKEYLVSVIEQRIKSSKGEAQEALQALKKTN